MPTKIAISMLRQKCLVFVLIEKSDSLISTTDNLLRCYKARGIRHKDDIRIRLDLAYFMQQGSFLQEIWTDLFKP